MRYLFLAALSILVLLGSPNPVLATIDFSMDTPGVIIQPTTVTVNLVVDTTSGGDTGSYGGVISIWFDPTKVEVSDPVANVTGYDMDCNFWDNVTGTQNFICTGLTEITATCSFLTFTVTPVGASADLSDCSVIRMTPGDFHVWPSSQLISLVYDTVYATGSCEETDSSSEETTDETTVPGPETTDTETDSNDETGGIVASSLFGCTPQIPATIRALKIAAGLMPANQSGNPNYKDTQSGEFPYLPLTLQDQATLEMVDTGGVSLLTHKITLADAVMLWNEQYLELPTNAVWAVAFLGSADDTCGNAANATGMPAIAQMDGYNAPEAIFPMGTINGQNYYPTFRYATGPETTHNPNAAYVVSDIGYGTFGLLNNWPRKLADAPTGVAVGAFTGGDYPQVLASNFQDQEGAGTINLYSRLYVWNHDGSGILDGNQNPAFPYTSAPTNTNARGLGHAIACPVLYDVDGDNTNEAVFTTQGQWDSYQLGLLGGAIQMLAPDGTVRYTTIPSTVATTPWRVKPGLSESAFETAPVMMKVLNSARRNVVAGSVTGDVYAWRTDAGHMGEAVSGFPAQTDVIMALGSGGNAVNMGKSPVSAIVTADVYGDDHAEIIVGAGRNLHYYTNTGFSGDGKPTQFNDGHLYCYSINGTRLWRYPKPLLEEPNENVNGYPAFDAGLALGRLRGPLTKPCIVFVRADGLVVALKGDVSDAVSDAERTLWSYQLPTTTHRYYQGAAAPPLILDANGDGYQDVIVGTTNGEIYVLNGNPPTNQGQPILGSPYTTFRGPDSVWDGTTVEQHFEEARGLAVGPLKTNQPSRAMLLVTTSRAGVTYPSQVGGHAVIFDLGPNTWNPDAADWTQYQQNAQRTGSFPN